MGKGYVAFIAHLPAHRSAPKQVSELETQTLCSKYICLQSKTYNWKVASNVDLIASVSRCVCLWAAPCPSAYPRSNAQANLQIGGASEQPREAPVLRQTMCARIAAGAWVRDRSTRCNSNKSRLHGEVPRLHKRSRDISCCARGHRRSIHCLLTNKK